MCLPYVDKRFFTFLWLEKAAHCVLRMASNSRSICPASHRTTITGIQRCAEHHFCFLFIFIYLKIPEKREKEKMGRKKRWKKRTQMESWKAVKFHVHYQDIRKFRDWNSNSAPHFQITLHEETIEAKRITKRNEWKNPITFSNHFFILNIYN